MLEITTTRSQEVGLNIGSIFSINLTLKMYLHTRDKILSSNSYCPDRQAHRQEDKHD